MGREKGFTLIELLVVITIIGLLASFLLPAVSRAKEQGNQAYCINNLHEFQLAIEMYESDQGEYPPWLSNMCKQYIKSRLVYQCKSDASRGKMGSKPSWRLPDEQTPTRFSETWDFETAESAARAAGGRWDSEAGAMQDPYVKANSYLYEYCPAQCSWWQGGMYPDPEVSGVYHDASDAIVDTNHDGKISWREAREFERNICGPQTPLVTCYWHSQFAILLHASIGNKNIYKSDTTRDGWKKLN